MSAPLKVSKLPNIKVKNSPVSKESSSNAGVDLDISASRLSIQSKGNMSMLADEMEGTIREILSFFTLVESQHNEVKALRKRKLKEIGKLDDVTMCQMRMKEKELKANLNLGHQIMRKLADASETTLYIPKSGKTSLDEQRIKNLRTEARSLVSKFVKILEEEGIEHHLPKKTPYTKVVKGKSTLPEAGTSAKSKDHLDKKEPVEVTRATICDLKVLCKGDTGLRSLKFLQKFADVRDIQLLLKECEIPESKNKSLSKKFTCSLGTLITATGVGKKKVQAVENAAAQIVKVLLKKEKKGTLKELPVVTQEEYNEAVDALCDSIDFCRELENICEKERIVDPVYLPLTNLSRATSGSVVRCKALGSTALGTGRTVEVARRKAAKQLIDMHHEIRAKRSEKPKFR